ncbi:alpha/beta fold hydrolase [Allofournierella sp.]|uniref:alpha/beta fold hydrolase n=1 Tax=Allofournierella sp. TaxID=1940256 RepID=UPI003AB13AAD
MFVKVNGLKLFYQRTGSGRPFVLLHGNMEDHTIFDVLVKELSREYTVYALDSRNHGKSDSVPFLDYGEMAEDVAGFIAALELERPLLCGFSDGGIIGLLVASRYPELLGKLVVSGANLTPQGIQPLLRAGFKLAYCFSRSEKLELMLTQPHITQAMLKRIKTPTLVLAGEKDLVTERETRALAAHIPGAKLMILPGEGHGSYVVHSDKLYAAMEPFLRGE